MGIHKSLRQVSKNLVQVCSGRFLLMSKDSHADKISVSTDHRHMLKDSLVANVPLPHKLERGILGVYRSESTRCQKVKRERDDLPPTPGH